MSFNQSDNEFNLFLMYHKFFFHEYSIDPFIRKLVERHGIAESFEIWHWHYKLLLEHIRDTIRNRTHPIVTPLSQEEFEKNKKKFEQVIKRMEKAPKLRDLI